MVFLNPDGSLDIERINSLPFEEYMLEMGRLTEAQTEEYISKLPPQDTKEPVKAIPVNYKNEEERKKFEGILASDFWKMLREKYGY
ncbi:MAG: hypothetical protein LIP02_09470 [Bacteroidales bacterium]|nr:hypothetical protein [Bacteroidales bacterium]